MGKRTALTAIVIFIVWSLMDFVIHNVLLQSTYQATAALWRPVEEMNIGLMYLTSLVFAASIAILYAYFVSPKSQAIGIKFGLILGFGVAFVSAFASYVYMPIPFNLAVSWFFASWIEIAVAGMIAGFILKN